MKGNTYLSDKCLWHGLTGFVASWIHNIKHTAQLGIQQLSISQTGSVQLNIHRSNINTNLKLIQILQLQTGQLVSNLS